MNWYRNFLSNFCNPRTGKRYWLWVEIIGHVMVWCWLFLAAPIGGSAVGIDWLGRTEYQGKSLNFVLYNGRFRLDESAYDYYFLIVLFGILFASLGVLAENLGENYRKGLVYIRPNFTAPLGEWKKGGE